MPPHELYQELLATHGIPTSVGQMILASGTLRQVDQDWHFLALAAGGLKDEALDLARRKVANPESASPVPYADQAVAFLGLAGDSEDIPLLRSFLNNPGYQAYEKEAVLPALTVLGDPGVVEIWRDILAEPGEYESSVQAAMALCYLGTKESEEFLDALVTQEYLHDVEWYTQIHPFDYGYSFSRHAQYFQSEATESYLIRYLEHNTNWHEESRYSMVECLRLDYPIFYEYADVILNTLMRNINSPKTRISNSAEGMLEGLLQISVAPGTVLPGHRQEFWTPYVEAFLEDWRAARQANSSFVPN